jgi:integrase/recombinase XerD
VLTSSASLGTSKPAGELGRQSHALCTVAGFYRYAEQEGLLEWSSAAHVHRPRLDDKSHATGLDRNQVGALLVTAGLPSANEHAPASLLGSTGRLRAVAFGNIGSAERHAQ